MLPFILSVFLVCAAPNVAEDLRASYCAAVQAWLPYTYAHPAVRWCFEDCGWLGVGGGGGFSAGIINTIFIDRAWPFKGNELTLTLEHEYGHALGLEHTAEGIMKSGWAPPIAEGPGPADFAALAVLH